MSPVLVDTSIWRKYFAGSASVRRLGELLDEDGATLIHPFVLGELVIGGLSAREEETFRLLPAAGVVAHDEVLEFVRRRRLTRKGIGWVDAHLLASAIVSAALLWTTDRDLSAAAGALGVAFHADPS